MTLPILIPNIPTDSAGAFASMLAGHVASRRGHINNFILRFPPQALADWRAGGMQRPHIERIPIDPTTGLVNGPIEAWASVTESDMFEDVTDDFAEIRLRGDWLVSAEAPVEDETWPWALRCFAQQASVRQAPWKHAGFVHPHRDPEMTVGVRLALSIPRKGDVPLHAGFRPNTSDILSRTWVLARPPVAR